MIKVGLYIDDFQFGTSLADSLSMANFQFKFFDKNDFNCNHFTYIIIDLDDLNNYNEIKLNEYKSAFSKTIVIVTSNDITKDFISSIKKLGWKWVFSKSTLRKNLINILNDVSA
tara:strand:- start:2161 stop:2502 length:342 start_codon:yes stop_codon:yes gene_type:complete